MAEGPAALAKLCEEQKLSSACAIVGREIRAAHVLPIMQGVTSNQHSRIVVLAPKGKGLTYYFQDKDGARPVIPATKTGPGLDQQLDVLDIFNINPAFDYQLYVVGPNAELWDRRKFRALDLNKKRPRFAFVSCMDDSLKAVQKQIWPELVAQNPDAVILDGDNTYADTMGGKSRPITATEQLWSRYAQTRSELEFFKANPLIPVLATWDDHDFGKNDGDRTFAFKDEAKSAFFAFFPQDNPAPGLQRGPGVASWWTAFGVQFALLDDRSFRSPDKIDSEDQTHLGPDQEKWLSQNLAEAKAPVFVVSGDQFFGGYHDFESFEGSHPKNFKIQLASWRKAQTGPLVFLSGDRHLTEIMKVPAEHLGYPTFEITSSGIHAHVYAEAFKKAPSPLQLVGRAGEYNYSIIEIMAASRDRLQLDVKSFGLNKKLLYQKTLMVKR